MAVNGNTVHKWVSKLRIAAGDFVYFQPVFYTHLFYAFWL